jgi:hypothetical protein
MSRRKQQGKRGGSGGGSRQPGPMVARKWSFNHLLLAILLGFGLGLGVGYYIAPATGVGEGGAVEESRLDALTDRFGRRPGDQHYGHDHP